MITRQTKQVKELERTLRRLEMSRAEQAKMILALADKILEQEQQIFVLTDQLRRNNGQ